jgi:hypothetical protein
MKVEQALSQGSVSGPLWFLPCINDITGNVLGANLVLFADYATLLITGKD